MKEEEEEEDEEDQEKEAEEEKEGTILILGFWFLLVKRLLKNQNHRHITEKQCLDAQLKHMLLG